MLLVSISASISKEAYDCPSYNCTRDVKPEKAPDEIMVSMFEYKNLYSCVMNGLKSFELGTK